MRALPLIALLWVGGFWLTPTPAGCAQDSDGDGTCDASDNCPLVSNAAQQDLDADAAGDACDADDDGDGIADATDVCPTVADPAQLDGDGDGIGNLCDVIVEDLADASFIAYGPTAQSYQGYFVEAGDLNQDQVADLLVGAPGAPGTPSTGSGGRGEVYVFFGPVSGARDLAVEAAERTIDSTFGWFFGQSGAIGDVIPDGVNDVALATPDAWGMCSCDTCFGGVVMLISGTQLTPGPKIHAVEVAEYEFTTCEQRLGHRTLLADLDGDTKPDLVASGAFPPGLPTHGYADLYLNNPIDDPPYGPEVHMYGGDGDYAGSDLAHGDLDGDGIDDLIIAAPGSAGPDELEPETGAIHVIFGTASGLPSSIELRSGASQVRIHGDAAGDRAGDSVAVGDWNGDGIDDLIVGATGADGPRGSGRIDAGAAYLIQGRVDFASLHESRLGNVARVRVDGDRAGARLGAAVALGDLDGDGAGDLVLGAPESNGPRGDRPQSGSVRVFPGARLPQATRFDLSRVPPVRIIHGSDAGDWLSGNAKPKPLIAPVTSSAFPALVLGTSWADGPGGSRFDAGELAVMDQPDTDGDGSIDTVDCLPDDASSIGLGPTGTQSYFEADRQTFVWTEVPGAESYTFFRGTLDGGWNDDALALADGLDDSSGSDASIPAPGTGFWYDSAAVSSTCHGPIGSASDGTPRTVTVAR